MINIPNDLNFLKPLTWIDVLLVLTILVAARLLVIASRWLIHRAAEKAPAHLRLMILRFSPLVRLIIDFASIVMIVPILVEPTFDDIAALVLFIFLGLAFALKDFASSLAAGLVTTLEGTYQPGDWIEVDGAYGEVKAVGLRAVHIVTADDTEVIIPHSKFWTSSIFNASSGNRGLLCVADFYLHPDHDAAAVRQKLGKMAEASAYRKKESPVTVIVLEKPWGTHYRVKVFAHESREQFLLISDLTVRGKALLRKMKIRFALAPYAGTAK